MKVLILNLDKIYVNGALLALALNFKHILLQLEYQELEITYRIGIINLNVGVGKGASSSLLEPTQGFIQKKSNKRTLNGFSSSVGGLRIKISFVESR